MLGPSDVSFGLVSQMIKTVEAIIDENGNVTLLEPVHPSGNQRALATILEENPTESRPETALLMVTLGRDT